MVGRERPSDVIGMLPTVVDGVDLVDSRPDAAVERLYREHVPGARRLGYLLTGNRDLAEDLVHDAFIRVAGRLRQIRDPEAFGAYLRRSVVNAVRSHYRHQAVADRYVAREASRPAHELYRDRDSELRDVLWEALQVLPERRARGDRVPLLPRHVGARHRRRARMPAGHGEVVGVARSRCAPPLARRDARRRADTRR